MLQALVQGNTGFDSSRSITDPIVHPVGPIPDCTKNLYLNSASCYEFVYSPNNNAIVNVRTVCDASEMTAPPCVQWLPFPCVQLPSDDYLHSTSPTRTPTAQYIHG